MRARVSHRHRPTVVHSLHAPSLRLLGVLGFVAAVGGCGRSELAVDDQAPPDEAGAVPDAAADAEAEAEAAAPEAAPSVAVPDVQPPSDPCQDAAPIPCPGGGARYCVAGHYSDCPTRCVACVPGSVRVCMLSYCEYWGTQTCAADGQSFGYCVEAAPPSECRDVARSSHDSSDLEQCCLDHGFCCRDDFDLNHNGNTTEQIGQCTGVTCS